jgi:hypothetical protein
MASLSTMLPPRCAPPGSNGDPRCHKSCWKLLPDAGVDAWALARKWACFGEPSRGSPCSKPQTADVGTEKKREKRNRTVSADTNFLASFLPTAARALILPLALLCRRSPPFAQDGRQLRGVRRYAGVGGLRAVRAPRGVLHLRRPPPLRDG